MPKEIRHKLKPRIALYSKGRNIGHGRFDVCRISMRGITIMDANDNLGGMSVGEWARFLAEPTMVEKIKTSVAFWWLGKEPI